MARRHDGYDPTVADMARIVALREAVMAVAQELGFGWMGWDLDERIGVRNPEITIILVQLDPLRREPLQ